MIVFIILNRTSMSLNIIYFVLLIILVLKTSGKVIDNIFKRELNWNDKSSYIESKDNSASPVKVKYLKPYFKNDVDFNAEKTYMAFTLYARNSDEGVFYFVSLETVLKIKKCGTNHAKAYYHFFNECPEAAENLIASGWCYQGENTKKLAFRSGTFNTIGGDYLDNRYYLDGMDREAHVYESKVLSQCFKNWRNSNFDVKTICTLESLSTTSAVDICADCKCDASLSDVPRLLTLSMVIISLLIV